MCKKEIVEANIKHGIKDIIVRLAILGVLFTLLMLSHGFMEKTCAESGNVYTCVITPSYKHPITGRIEDTGGSGSESMGQGMVKSVVGGKGILEETDGGQYILTFRMSMMDMTSNHKFWVQNQGENGWRDPAVGVTGTGSDGHGTTNDVAVQLPSKNSVVRIQVFVKPMSRNVIFYIYPSGFTLGNSTDMKATIVTKKSNGKAKENARKDKNNAKEIKKKDEKSDGKKMLESKFFSEGLSLSTEKNIENKETEVPEGATKNVKLVAALLMLLVSATLAVMGFRLYRHHGKLYRKEYKNDEFEYDEK